MLKISLLIFIYVIGATCTSSTTSQSPPSPSSSPSSSSNDPMERLMRMMNLPPVNHKRRKLQRHHQLRHRQPTTNRKRRGAVVRGSPWRGMDADRVQHFMARFPRLKRILENQQEMIRQMIVAEIMRGSTSHLTSPTSASSSSSDGGGGVVRRKMRLWCRSGIGYHLEVNKRGRVVGRHQKTSDGQ